MASNFQLISNFEPKGSHSYLIDTNILMYLFSPIASYGEKRQEIISSFLGQCQKINSGIITTSAVISEFFHVNLNIYFDNWCREQKTSIQYNLKKDFRPTDDYKDCVKAINASISAILKLSHRFPDNFNSVEIENVLTHCFKAEFTDSYLLELSNANGWIIISNDKDLLEHPNRRSLLVTPNFS